MAMHFSIGADQVACGRNNHKLTATSQYDSVTCKVCRGTEAFRSSVVANATDTNSLNTPVGSPSANQGNQGKAAFKEWMHKLKGNDRLPRGKFFASRQPGLKTYRAARGHAGQL
ncbi:hypothetical protein [Pseudomonas monteilii]|uniref:hypothetical protein n=1 Tax=Pseudomonas monteilii TaxID=76759 RepID=UPI0015FA7DD8|nr:hypothetical protein [Pseudomonas monteilii]MBA6105258.1 hypothetical protein [Pseudomonas monteilii]